jgi:hypothetical protein
MCAFSYRPSARPAELLVPNPKLKFLDQCREFGTIQTVFAPHRRKLISTQIYTHVMMNPRLAIRSPLDT